MFVFVMLYFLYQKYTGDGQIGPDGVYANLGQTDAGVTLDILCDSGPAPTQSLQTGV